MLNVSSRISRPNIKFHTDHSTCIRAWKFTWSRANRYPCSSTRLKHPDLYIYIYTDSRLLPLGTSVVSRNIKRFVLYSILKETAEPSKSHKGCKETLSFFLFLSSPSLPLLKCFSGDQRRARALEKIVILSGITLHSSKLARWSEREGRDTRGRDSGGGSFFPRE